MPQSPYPARKITSNITPSYLHSLIKLNSIYIQFKAMEKSKATVGVMSFLVLLAMVMITILPSKTQALIPYTRSPFLDLMFPQEDPFKILEQTPLTIPTKGVESIALARSDWKETAKEHIITLDIPGMKKEDIKIEVEENRVLRISGERKTEEEVNEGEKWHRAERTYGKFLRQFRLPRNVDLEHVKAHLENGVLKIVVPKLAEEKKQSKLISISEEGNVAGGEDIKTTKAAM